MAAVLTSGASLLDASMLIEGSLKLGGDLHLPGRLTGAIQVDGNLTVSGEGLVNGNVTAESADIAGTVSGNLVVRDRLVLRSTSRISVGIKSVRLIVEEGAGFENVEVHCGSDTETSALKYPVRPGL